MIKVSVVVPTYKTAPDGLQRLMDSLDGQTMGSDEFEIVFIDDGSPDDTYDRLKALQATRANVHVDRIENSGWPSRPRNIGIDTARGEYVLFMDHDDTLYPDALRAGYEMAHANGSDVLTGKESRTDDPGWMFDSFEKDEPQALGGDGGHPLAPLNPHKLYRRQLLEEHSIRFPEGRLVLWEDQFFNLQVARHAKVMSRLASVPFYHWVTTEGSGTTLFNKSGAHYWQLLRKLLEAVDEELSGADLMAQHEQIARSQYSARVLGAFGVTYVKRAADARRLIFTESRALREDFDLARFDDDLSVSVRLRAALVGKDRQDLLERLCAEDVAIAGWGRAVSAAWDDGRLNVTVTIAWASAEGRRPALRREGSRILKVLSPQLSETFTADDLDMTADIARTTGAFAIRNRHDKVVWKTPSTWSVWTEDAEDGSVRIAGTLTTSIDPTSAQSGADHGSGYWDLQTRVRLGNAVTQRNLRYDLPSSMSISGGHLHLVYREGGNATLATDAQVEAVRRLTPLSATRGTDGQIRVRLSGIHDGKGRIQTLVGVDTSTAIHDVQFTECPATLHIDGGEASLTFEATSPVMRVRIGDRSGQRPKFWTLFIDASGVVLNAGQLPKVRTADEIAADLDAQQRTKAAPTSPADQRSQPVTPRRRIILRMRRRVGRVLRRWGLR